jgi:membrane-associated phospholipid phosphatase
MQGVRRMNRRALAALLALSCGRFLFAEGAAPFPYALDPVKDSAWIAGDLALYGASLYLDGVKPSADPARLDSSNIPWFDKLYTTKHSTAMGTATDLLVVAAAALPGVALPGLSFRQTLTLGTMWAETLGLAYCLDAAIKSAVVRFRPYAYASPAPSDIGSLDISSSFPSRHATLAFASAVFAGSTFDELHPSSPYRGVVWGTGLGVATLISSLRVASGDHFVSDVVAGAALGALCGFAVPLLHRIGGDGQARTESRLSLDLSPSGFVAELRLGPRAPGSGLRPPR